MTSEATLKPTAEPPIYLVSDRGEVLASRPTGRIIREEMERTLMAIPDSSCLLVSLQGVVAISPSCADELFGRLYSEISHGEFGNRLAVLEEVTSDHREILEPILRRRGVLALAKRGKDVRILGGPEHLLETYKTARRLSEFRASELARKLKLTVPATDNRLAKLWRSHLLRRTAEPAKHGGREYVYRASV